MTKIQNIQDLEQALQDNDTDRLLGVSVPKGMNRQRQTVPLVSFLEFQKPKKAQFQHNHRIYILLSYSVVPTRASGVVCTHGSDDATYTTAEMLQFPRAAYALHIFQDTGSWIRCVYGSGYAKFSGTPSHRSTLDTLDEDPDDEDPEAIASNNAILEIQSEGALTNGETAVICGKENGKTVTMKVVQDQEYVYIVIGTKTRARMIMLVSVEEYEKETFRSMTTNEMKQLESASLIHDIWQVVQAQLHSFTSNNRRRLLTFCENQCATIVAEYLDWKHMVVPSNGDRSPQVICFGYSTTQTPTTFLLAKESRIDQQLQLLQSFGFHVTSFQTMNISTLNQTLESNDFRMGKNLEGSVICIYDAKNTFLTRMKYKTYWYIIIRMLRQILISKVYSHKKHVSLLQTAINDTSLLKRIWDTLNARNSFMNLSLKCLYVWYELCVGFVHYMITHTILPSRLQCRNGDGIGFHWNNFIHSSKMRDSFDSLQELQNSLPHDYEFVEPSGMPVRVALHLSGLPGTGKDTLAIQLIQMLTTLTIKSVWISQDMHGSGNQWLNPLHQLVRDKTIRVIVVARCHGRDSTNRSEKIYRDHHLVSLFAHQSDDISNVMLLQCIINIFNKDRSKHPLSQLEPYKMFQALTHQYQARFSMEEVQQKFHVIFDANQFRKVTIPEPILQVLQRLTHHAPWQVWNPTPEQTEERQCFYQDLVSRVVTAGILQETEDGTLLRGPLLLQDPYVPISETVQSYITILQSVLSGETKAHKLVPASPSPKMIGISLPESFRQDLRSRVISPSIHTVSSVPKLLSYYHHLTLMHSSERLTNIQLWKHLLDMANNNLKLKVLVHGYIRSDTGIVFDCDVQSIEDTSMNHLVLSKVPHITGALPEGVKPVASIHLMKKAKVMDCVTQLEGSISCVAPVMLFYD